MNSKTFPTHTHKHILDLMYQTLGQLKVCRKVGARRCESVYRHLFRHRWNAGIVLENISLPICLVQLSNGQKRAKMWDTHCRRPCTRPVVQRATWGNARAIGSDVPAIALGMVGRAGKPEYSGTTYLPHLLPSLGVSF